MTESYTYGGNAFEGIPLATFAAQTFAPRLTHKAEFVDVELFLTGLHALPRLQIYDTKPDGSPGDNPLTPEASFLHAQLIQVGRIRFRYHIKRVTLHEGTTYALVLKGPHYITDPVHGWEYDKDAALYPRGQRYLSINAGIDWTPYPDQDHIFAEFGNPPVIPSKVDPPVPNFATLDMIYTHWDIGLAIRFPSSVPCHLTCYWTDKRPLKHPTSRILRGLKVPWQTYYCFVAWHPVEQTEIGDTLYHTFELPDWKEDETRWFTLRGEVDLVDVPSVGPIFEHTHPGGLPRFIDLRPYADGDLTQIWARYPPVGTHYSKVWEVIADEDATYVYMPAWASATRTDLYALDNPPVGIGKIKKVTIYARWRRQGGFAYAIDFWSKLKTHGTIYSSPPYENDGLYETISWEHLTNPFTGDPWTFTELFDLQAGITLEVYIGVGWAASGRCTQVYATIERGIEGGPD